MALPVGDASAASSLAGKVEDKPVKRSGTVLGLALTWDNSEAIRERMRAGWNLLVHYDPKLKRCMNGPVEKTMYNVKQNLIVLEPVCRLASKRVIPKEELEHEVKQMFGLWNVLANATTISKQAWAIRHLIHVLKQSVKGHKEDPTRIRRCPQDRKNKKQTI